MRLPSKSIKIYSSLTGKHTIELYVHLFFWAYVFYRSANVGFNQIRECEEVEVSGRKLENITLRQNQGVNDWQKTKSQPLPPHKELWWYRVQKTKNCLEITYYDGQIISILLVGNLFKMTLFYGIALLILPIFLKKRKFGQLIGLGLLWVGGVFILELGLDYIYLQSRTQMIYPDGFRPNNWSDVQKIQVGLYPWFLFWAMMYRFGKDWLLHQHLQEQLQKEKLHTELSFLKSQINPHFLFNTLNNLYGLALTQQANRTAEGIAKLAQQMRYMLYESEVNEVELHKEVAYIQTFISLQKLRFNTEDDIEINFQVKGDIPSYRIAPMLLIPFIENAFKHSLSFEQSVRIAIALAVKENELYFEVRNTINLQSAFKDTHHKGLGLVNVRRRLELLYPKAYHLQIEAKDNYFVVKLQILLPIEHPQNQ